MIPQSAMTLTCTLAGYAIGASLVLITVAVNHG